MTEKQDTRWIQRFNNYEKVVARMEALASESSKRELNEVKQEALIQRFEYTQELAWLVIKDSYESLGETGMQGSRDAFQLAFRRGLIQNGTSFMESIEGRNEAAHTYNEEIARKLYRDILEKYLGAFVELREALKQERQKRKL